MIFNAALTPFFREIVGSDDQANLDILNLPGAFVDATGAVTQNTTGIANRHSNPAPGR